MSLECVQVGESVSGWELRSEPPDESREQRSALCEEEEVGRDEEEREEPSVPARLCEEEVFRLEDRVSLLDEP